MHPESGLEVGGAGDAIAALLLLGQFLHTDDLSLLVAGEGDLIGDDLVQALQPQLDCLALALAQTTAGLQPGTDQLGALHSGDHSGLQALVAFSLCQAELLEFSVGAK